MRDPHSSLCFSRRRSRRHDLLAESAGLAFRIVFTGTSTFDIPAPPWGGVDIERGSGEITDGVLTYAYESVRTVDPFAGRSVDCSFLAPEE